MQNAPALRCRPYLPWIIAALCVVATLGAIFAGSLSAVINSYGFVPGEPLRAGGITIITSFFLHLGWLHLAGNMWFLLIAGDNCEDLLGKPRYVLVLAGGTMAALVTHGLFDPRPDVPLVGASGGISALLAFYALALPHVRLALCLRLGGFKPGIHSRAAIFPHSSASFASWFSAANFVSSRARLAGSSLHAQPSLASHSGQ